MIRFRHFDICNYDKYYVNKFVYPSLSNENHLKFTERANLAKFTIFSQTIFSVI